MDIGMNGFKDCAERLSVIGQPLIQRRRGDGICVKVVLRDEGMGGAVLVATAPLFALTVLAGPSVRHLVCQLQGDHSYQKGNQQQRWDEYEPSFPAEHEKLPGLFWSCMDFRPSGRLPGGLHQESRKIPLLCAYTQNGCHER